MKNNRLEFNRHRLMKNLVSGITAMAVVMGSTSFVLAAETYCGYPASYNHPAHTLEDGCYEMEETTCDGAGCYALTCTITELHGHSDDCYKTEMICGVADENLTHEHSAEANCYKEVADYENLTCTTTHPCDDAECTEPHHTDACYGTKSVLDCSILPEGHGAAHTDACFETTKLCVYDYDHAKHDINCYEAKEDLAEGTHEGTCYEAVLDCEKDIHEHSAICFVPEEEQQAALDVEAAIAALTTASEKVGVEDARFNYNALNALQKAVVDEEGLDVKLAALEINLGIAELPAAADAIGTDLYDAKQLRDGLDDLEDDEDYKAEYVPNKAALDAYNDTLNDAEAVIDMIEDLPEAEDYNSNDKDEVEEAYDAYTALNANERELVNLVDDDYITKLYDLVALAVDVYQVATDQVPGATVKIFNYDETANTKGLSAKGYTFVHGNYIKVDEYNYTAKDKTDGTNSEKAKYGIEGSVDGTGTSITYDGPILDNVMTNTYPYPYDSTEGKNAGMDHLFADNCGYLEGTMANGGGLFQLKNGYYEYNSSDNAAYYNKSTNEFEVYNVEVVPFYSDYNGAHRGNFLPFNPVEGKDANNKAYIGINNQYGAIDGKGAYTADHTVGDVEYKAGDTSVKHDNYVEGKTYVLSAENPTDNWFGMTVEFDFLMPKDGKMGTDDMIFDFSGDDDVFVYIDNKLVLDIGGCHAALPGSINFATGEVKHYPRDNAAGAEVSYNMYTGEDLAEGDAGTNFGGKFADYTTHNFKFFYMERGGNISNCRIKFNMPTLPENSLLIGKEVTVKDHTNGLALAEELTSTLEYKFQVVDENGEILVKNTNYKVLDGTNYEVKRISRVNAENDQMIMLHPGELAQIENMPAFAGNSVTAKYFVEELLPEDLAGQYDKVHVTIGETTGTIEAEKGNKVDGFVGIKSAEMTTGETLAVTFDNEVETESLGKLEIKKMVTNDSWSIFDKTFEFKVELNGQELSNDIQYTVKDPATTTAAGVKKNISNDGTIKLKKGQTAILDGIMAGTEYEVKEVKVSGFEPTYFTVEEYTATRPVAGSLTGETETYTDTKTVTVDGSKVTGTLGLEETAVITVENESNEFEVPFTIAKTAQDVEADKAYKFFFDIEATDAEGKEFEDFEVREDGGTKDLGDRVEIEVSRDKAKCDCNVTEVHQEACTLNQPAAEPECTCEPSAEGIHAAECDLNKDAAEPECDCEPTIIHKDVCATLPQIASSSRDLALVFDRDTEAGTYRFKVTEFLPMPDERGYDSDDDHTQKFEYDKSEYVVEVEVDPAARGARAKVIGMTKDDNAVDVADGINMGFVNKTDANEIVTKIWKYDGDKVRPDSIEIIVYRNGVEFERHTMTDANETGENIWTMEIDYIDPEDGYTWTIDEVEPGLRYTKSVDGFIVTNTWHAKDKDPDPIVTPETPKEEPKDNPPSDNEEEGLVLGAVDEVPEEEMVLGASEEMPLLAGVAETGDSKTFVTAGTFMAVALVGIFQLRKKKEN